MSQHLPAEKCLHPKAGDGELVRHLAWDSWTMDQDQIRYENKELMQTKDKKRESINIQLVITPQDVYKKLHIPNSSFSSFVGGQSQNLARASADRSLECEGALSGTNKKNLSNGLEPQLDRFDFIAVSCFRSLLISVSFFSSFQQPPKLEFWVPKHPNVNISASLQVLANFSVGGNASSAFWRWLPHAIQQQRCPPLPNPPQSEERLQIACGKKRTKGMQISRGYKQVTLRKIWFGVWICLGHCSTTTTGL